MKEFLLVFFGSGIGGGLRYAISKMVSSSITIAFPLGTFTVNIVGCLLIGFLSALPQTQHWLSPSARLLLTTGFCGGFTTFSTFMKESHNLIAGQMPLTSIIYIALSVIIGLAAMWGGYKLGLSN